MSAGETLGRELQKSAQRLRQYARLAVSRILGTTSTENGAYKQLVDMEASRAYHRSELNALAGILIKKGILTREEWTAWALEEMREHEKELAVRWPEASVAEDGSSFSLDIAKLQERIRREGWPP